MTRKLLHPATFISLIALFVALGGTSYAVSQLPKNSVGTAQLKSSAVTSAKVKDRSLLAKDFKAGQLPAGERGPRGEQGPSFSFSRADALMAAITTNTLVAEETVALPAGGRLTGIFSGVDSVSGAPGDSAAASCFVRLNGLELISQIVPSSPAGLTAAGYYDGQIQLVFNYEVPAAGDYLFEVFCTKQLITGSPTLEFGRYTMTGVLTGS